MLHLIFLKDTFNSMYIKVSLYEVSIIMILKMMKFKVSLYEVSINKILYIIHLLFLKDTIILLKVSILKYLSRSIY